MNQLPRSILGAAIAAVLATPGIVWAQSADAALRGKAPANTAVSAKNVATGATRRTQANAEGYYALSGLPPGTYRVDAGPGTETTVTLSVASTATLDLTASSGAVEAPEAGMQEITVEGRRLSEVRTSEVGATVSEHQIETVPQITRNFLEFADTVPGVVFEVDGSGRTKISGGAQNTNGVNLYIDGVGQKGYVRSGVSGQAGDTQGNPFPQLAIGEYKVITSNYKAEYDQISSAAITAVTRSGTNDLQGSFFWDRTSDLWREATPTEERAGAKAHTSTEQYGMSVGGPILKDRLFYFVTYEGKDITSPRTISANPIAFNAPLPADLFALTGPTAAPFTEGLWFGKLTWQPDGDNLVEFSMKQRNEDEITGVDGQNTYSYGTQKSNDSTRGDLRWQFNAENWLNDAHLTYEDESWSPHAINTGIGFQFTGTNSDLRDGTVLNVGAGRDFQDKGQKGWSLQDDFTWLGFEGHTMKAGFKYKAVEINAFEQQPYNPQFFVNLPTNLAVGNDTSANTFRTGC